MALTKIFDFIGAQIKTANPWINTYAVNCIQLPDTKVGLKGRVVNFIGEEKEYLGIDDSKGAAFYIRTNPKFTYLVQRQISSCEPTLEVTIPFKFVFFAINQDEDYSPLVIENIITNNIRQLSFSDYLGTERKIKIVIQNSNTDAFQIFFDEIGKKFDVGAKAVCVSVECQLKFLSTKDCEEDCGVSINKDALKDINFCNQNIIDRLTAVQVACLKIKFGGGGVCVGVNILDQGGNIIAHVNDGGTYPVIVLSGVDEGGSGTIYSNSIIEA